MNRLLKGWRPYLLLLIIACVVYWPLTFGIFSLKNDALIYFLPWRYHISESIQAGHFPFWNPYLYTGLPLHSDIQSGAWNPVVLLTSVFTRYNMQVLQWELLLYIFLAGASMYKLVRETNHTMRTAFICSVSYMCCGFITDSGSFIPWITSAAYIPFIVLYFYRSVKIPSFSTALKLGICLFLLFTAGYPSFFIYTSYILLAAFIAWMIRGIRNNTRPGPVIKYLLVSMLLFGILATPAIISYTDFFPYYQRGVTTGLAEALTNPFPPFSSISYLLPPAVEKPHAWISTDLAMRNAYVGIFILLFCMIAFTHRLNFFQKLVVGITVFSFLFSLGDHTPLRKWCYDLLPLMDRFRHPGIIRLFTSIGIILLAAKSLDGFFAGIMDRKKIKIAFTICILLILGFTLYYLINGGSAIKTGGGIKQVLDNLGFANLAVIAGVIQLFFLGLSFLTYRKKELFTWTLLLNVMVFAWMSLPFTFVSQTKTKDINQYIRSFPKGYPLPDMDARVAPVHSPADSIFGYSVFYNKNITIQDNIISPTVNRAYHEYLLDPVARETIEKHPFAWCLRAEGVQVDTVQLSLSSFTPTQFHFVAEAQSPNRFILIQQYNHHWTARVNEEKVTIKKNGAFMEVPVPAGKSDIVFKFEPGKLLCISMYISAALLFLTIIYLGLLYRRKTVDKGSP